MASAPEVFNVFWVHPAPKTAKPVAGASRRNPNTVALKNGVPAVILYPAFLTPGMVVGDQDLELLLLVMTDYELAPADVNRQLKIAEGLDPAKPYTTAALFNPVKKGDLEVEKVGEVGTDAIATATAFRGVLDKRIVKLYKEWKFTTVYRVKVKGPVSARTGGDAKDHSMTAADGSVYGKELHDQMVREVLEKLNGKGLPESGNYCFDMKETGARKLRDVDLGAIDITNPVQAYHPVFKYAELGHAAVGHVSDVHVSSRQNILAATKARVIDYNDGTGEADKDVAPDLGPVVNIASMDVREIMTKMADAGADLIFAGGDLIDYIRNTWLASFANLSVAEMWAKLQLNDDFGDEQKDIYQRFTDYVSFYSLMVDFYVKSGRPVFAITGNHDCYTEPYGISPRFAGVRANEGIPADHNLTIYEGILAFGKTYGEITTISMFTPDEFLWFHGVLTPFKDFDVALPKQEILGLAWGEDEDLLEAFGMDQGSGWIAGGHLPRSDDDVTDGQLAFLKKGVERAEKKGGKVVLSTHFTFVSYRESVANNWSGDGDVEFDIGADYGDHDMGTFETNRKTLYEDLIGGRKIHTIVTGHSHRRGLYLVTEVDYDGDNSVHTRMFDYHQLAAVKKKYAKQMEPAIIVSDSAGSIPRMNLGGEFDGWGSDPPAGTLIKYDDAGNLDKLEPIRASVAPRFVVALDYMDVIAEKRVIQKFETAEIKVDDEKAGKLGAYAFEVWLNQKLYDHGVYISDIRLYCLVGEDTWDRVTFSYDPDLNRWVLEGDDMETFANSIVKRKHRGRFLAMKFGYEAEQAWRWRRYDFDSWWTFECQPREVEATEWIWSDAKKKYKVERDAKKAEIPDFDWRKKMAKYKAGATP